MQSLCYLEDLQCDIVFKFLAGSDTVGVWWVNPVQSSQQLHLGQYHVGKHAWYDVSRRFGQLYVSDAQCLQSRPAVGLQAAQVAKIREFAQSLWQLQAAEPVAA